MPQARGRPRLGAGTKSVVGSARFTQEEARLLTIKYGSLSKALRSLGQREAIAIKEGKSA